MVCEDCGRRYRNLDAFNRHRRDEHRRFQRRRRRRLDESLIYDDRAEPPRIEDGDLDAVLRQYWHSVRTFHTQGRVLDIVNVRTWSGGDPTYEGASNDALLAKLRTAFQNAGVRVKLNVSPGCVLRNKNTNELRYFHSSSNNATVFPSPRLVSTNADLQRFVEDLAATDVSEQVVARRPNTEWTLVNVTNLTFYLYKILGGLRIGVAPDLPEYLLRNRHLVSMIKARGERIKDNACFFRCLVFSQECRCQGRCYCKSNDISMR